jgi:hypothetical protein
MEFSVGFTGDNALYEEMIRNGMPAAPQFLSGTSSQERLEGR